MALAALALLLFGAYDSYPKNLAGRKKNVFSLYIKNIFLDIISVRVCSMCIILKDPRRHFESTKEADKK